MIHQTETLVRADCRRRSTEFNLSSLVGDEQAKVGIPGRPKETGYMARNPPDLRSDGPDIRAFAERHTAINQDFHFGFADCWQYTP
jgi:hypothetical protein